MGFALFGYKFLFIQKKKIIIYPGNQIWMGQDLKFEEAENAMVEGNIHLGLVTSRAEPSFEHFELGLLIYERPRARAELLNELKIRLKLGLI